MSRDDEKKLFTNAQGKINAQCHLCEEALLLTDLKWKKGQTIETNVEYCPWKPFSPDLQNRSNPVSFTPCVRFEETYSELKN